MAENSQSGCHESFVKWKILIKYFLHFLPSRILSSSRNFFPNIDNFECLSEKHFILVKVPLISDDNVVTPSTVEILSIRFQSYKI